MSLRKYIGGTLFLDRDGVINSKIVNDYVKEINQFEFIPGSLAALKILSEIFARIIVVTNQKGVGKGLMTVAQLDDIHNYMTQVISKFGGRVDKIYYCTSIYDSSSCRKPNTGMIKQAMLDYPEIDINRSLMIGDSWVDMELAKRLNITSIYIPSEGEKLDFSEYDYKFSGLISFANEMIVKIR